MTKKEYLETLNTELERLNIDDRADASNEQSPRKRSILFYSVIGLSVIAFPFNRNLLL